MNKTELQQRLLKGTGVTYYQHIPVGIGTSPSLFISVHGWSRNVLEHAYDFLPLARAYGVVLVTPLFETRRFPHYQRLGCDIGKGRADLILNRIVDTVRLEIGVKRLPLFLFGYSGGGQFVQRYTMAYPDRVMRLALGAPGWYTFPDPAHPFPLGIASIKQLPDIHFNPSAFLKISTKVLVGELDTRRNHHLNTSKRVDQMQGVNRQERALRRIQSMTAAARACNYNTIYTLELLPNSDHSFHRCMEKGGMGDAAFSFLFGPRP